MSSSPVAPPAQKTFLEEPSFEDAVRHLVRDYRNRGVVILKEIFQGSNAIYTQAHQSFGRQFKFERDGLCDAISMEFIRLGRRGGSGAADFRSLIDENWAYLGLLQSEFTGLKKVTAKPLLELNSNLNKQIGGHENKVRAFNQSGAFGKFFGSLGLGGTPSRQEYEVSKEALAIKEKIIDSEADKTQQALRELQANTVYCSNDPTVLAGRQDVFDNVALTNVVPQLMNAFNMPAYYYLVLADLGKHAMAFDIRANGTNNRFMDPNGYELQIGTRYFMRLFLIDYFKIYASPNWGSLQHSQCKLVRFT